MQIATRIQPSVVSPVAWVTTSPLSDAATVEGLAGFASELGCASDYLGESIERNTCSGDWYYDMDLSISQEIPGPGRFFAALAVRFRTPLVAAFRRMSIIHTETGIAAGIGNGGSVRIDRHAGQPDSFGKIVLKSLKKSILT